MSEDGAMSLSDESEGGSSSSSSSGIESPVSGPAKAPPMPWFGIDIGGTLAKLVYFEPNVKSAPLSNPEDEFLLSSIRYAYISNHALFERF